MVKDLEKLSEITGVFKKFASGRDVQERLMESGKGIEESPMGGVEYNPKAIKETPMAGSESEEGWGMFEGAPGIGLVDKVITTQVTNMFEAAGDIPPYIELFIDNESIGVFEYDREHGRYSKLPGIKNVRQVGLTSEDVQMLLQMHFDALKGQEKEFYKKEKKRTQEFRDMLAGKKTEEPSVKPIKRRKKEESVETGPPAGMVQELKQEI